MLTSQIVPEYFDWFLKSVLKDHYDKRRQALIEANEETIPAIDYIFKTYIGKEKTYPPESSAQFNKYLLRLDSERSKVFKQLILIYLKLDTSRHLLQKENLNKSRTKDKAELVAFENALSRLQSFPHAFDIPNSILHLSTGLWAVDNEDTNLTISSLSNPSIDLSNYFEKPQEVTSIIVDSLIIGHQPRIALFMSKIYRYESWYEKYDAIYAFLLVSSGLLIEALKYERLFSDREDYHEILQRFFKLCSEWNVTKSLNCFNLSHEEEDVLNQHLISESRPVTPSGTKSSSRPKPRNRRIQVVQRTPSFNDSPARNTRSARKRKT